MPTTKKPEQLALTVSVIDRGSGNKLTKLYNEHQVFSHLRCEGTGTATSEILDILGLGSSEKDIIMSIAPMSTTRALLDLLNDRLRSAVPGRGIAFALPLTAVNNVLATFINLKTKPEPESGGNHMEEKKNSLIMLTVNQGYTDAVMETARKAGARGGTIIRGRWVGDRDFEQAYGIKRNEEKEVLFIVVPNEIRSQVMDAINDKHGLRSESGALVCSLGIDQLVHLG